MGAVLLAVSGGRDSMCLADLTLRSGRPFAVAHVNFHLRGADSDADEELVRSWCAARAVPFHVQSFDTVSYAAREGLSIEMAARRLRYRWFGALCASEGYAAVAVAHHAQDNVETLILNLLRGTGLRGVCGMDPVGELPDSDQTGIPLIRPLLGFSREQIQQYVQTEQVPYREDATNAETQYKRNRIRHEVLPVFEQINPAYLSVLNRDMAHFAQAQAVLDRWYAAVTARLVREEGAVQRVDLRALAACPDRDYLLYRLMAANGFHEAETASVAALLDGSGTRSGKVFRNASRTLVTATGELLFFDTVQGDETDTAVVIPGPGTYQLGVDRFSVEVRPADDALPLKQPGSSCLDADRLPFPFVVRRPQPGDWLKPIGTGGRKKLSNLFTDLKFSLLDKAGALLVLPPGEPHRICALAGWRVDERYRVRPDTQQAVVIRRIL